MGEFSMVYEYRNPKFNQHGSIDVEINHPSFGWIPFTADPEDCEESGRALYGAILAEGKEKITPYSGPSVDEIDLEMWRETAIASEFQAKAALMQAGLLDDVIQFVAQADALTQLAWQSAREFKRSSHLVSEIGKSLQLSDEQIDDLFRFAKTIEV